MSKNCWRKVSYRGKMCLLFEGRPESVVKEDHPCIYMLRHGDSDWSEPLTVEEKVRVNLWGYLLMPKPMLLGRKRQILLSKRVRERFMEGGRK